VLLPTTSVLHDLPVPSNRGGPWAFYPTSSALETAIFLCLMQKIWREMLWWWVNSSRPPLTKVSYHVCSAGGPLDDIVNIIIRETTPASSRLPYPNELANGFQLGRRKIAFR